MIIFNAEEPLQLESQPTAGEHIIGRQIQDLLMAKSSFLVLDALRWPLISLQGRFVIRAALTTIYQVTFQFWFAIASFALAQMSILVWLYVWVCF